MSDIAELERSAAVRRALEDAAKKLEGMHGADAYMRAWRKAADIIRKLKPD